MTVSQSPTESQPSVQRTTETVDDPYVGLDTWPIERVLHALHDAQGAAVAAVGPALPAIGAAAGAAARRLAAGGRLVYVGAGSSALMALADGLEIPQTYGVPDEAVRLIVPGGVERLSRLDGVLEDRRDLGQADVAAANIGAADFVLAIAASGATPYTLAGLAADAGRGAETAALVCNRNAPLLDHARHGIVVATPPEVIAGSTRMGAGTAQKVALNIFSTALGLHLGHVYDGLMVNLRADNDKLRARAAGIVARIGGVGIGEAETALREAGGEVKIAVLLLRGLPQEKARSLLLANGGNLRLALARVGREGTGTE